MFGFAEFLWAEIGASFLHGAYNMAMFTKESRDIIFLQTV